MTPEQTIISRKEAQSRGLKTYFTGKPCKHNHVAFRGVEKGDCRQCGRLATDKWMKDNSEHVKETATAWRKNNVSRRRETNKKWKKNNAERVRETTQRRREINASREKEVRLKWYAANRERARARFKKWQLKNPDKLKSAQDKWRKNNWERVLFYAHSRRARKHNNGGSYSSHDIAEIMRAQREKCAYCRIDLNKVCRHIDHIMPLSKGGSNEKINLQLLCRPCNQRKSNRDPLEYARLEGLLL